MSLNLILFYWILIYLVRMAVTKPVDFDEFSDKLTDQFEECAIYISLRSYNVYKIKISYHGACNNINDNQKHLQYFFKKVEIKKADPKTSTIVAPEARLKM